MGSRWFGRHDCSIGCNNETFSSSGAGFAIYQKSSDVLISVALLPDEMFRSIVICSTVIGVFFLSNVSADAKISRQLQCSIRPIDGTPFKSAFCYNHWPTRKSLSPEVVELKVYAALVPKITSSMLVDTGLNVTALTTLRLIKCNVERIDSDFFTNLTSIEQIELTDNKLAFISRRLFATNKRLSHLVLRSNQFKMMPVDLPQSLQELDLADNNIRFISDNSPLTNLRHLNLCGNQLEDAANIVDIYPNLEVLCIGDNALAPRLTGFENACQLKELTLVGKNTQQAYLNDIILKSLKTCSRLRELSIQHYQLSSLDFLAWFSQLQKLELIQVYVNEEPTGNLFKTCANLSSINLSGSQQLTDAILYNPVIHKSMDNISYLNVENCGLTDLRWLPLKSLTRLDISKNPLNCEDPVTKHALCELQEDYLKKSPTPRITKTKIPSKPGPQVITLEHRDLIQCRVGTQLSSMNYSVCSNLPTNLDITTSLPKKEQFKYTITPKTTSKNQTKLWIIIFGIFGAILLIIGVSAAVFFYRRRMTQVALITKNDLSSCEVEEQSSSIQEQSNQVEVQSFSGLSNSCAE